MNLKKLFFVLMVLLLQAAAEAQQPLNFKTADSLTYALYTGQQWDSLVRAGKAVLHNDIDYYYLRMRLGIARYMQNKPFFATNHFKKALKFSKDDPAALSYLYNSYLLTGNVAEAKKLTRRFTPSLKKKLGIKPEILENIDVSSGYKFSNNYDKNRNIYLMGNDSIIGKQLLLKDQKYGHFGASLRFFNALSLYMGYDYLSVDKTNRFQYREFGLKRDSTVQQSWGYQNYFSDTVAQYDVSFDTKILQNNFYFNIGYQMNNGWSAGVFANLIYLKSQKVNPEYNLLTKTDTAYYLASEDRYETFDYPQDQYRFTIVDTSFFNFIAGIWLQKNWDVIKLNAEISLGNLDGYKQQQVSAELLYYPFGNTNLYGISRITVFGEQKLPARWLGAQTVGIKLFPKFWVEAAYRQGDFSNVQFSKGFVVYNLPEKVNFSAGINLLFYAGKHANINLWYQYFDNEGKYATFDKENNEDISESFNYQSNNIILELIWKF